MAVIRYYFIGDQMNNSIDKTNNKYDSPRQYTKLITRIALTFLLSSLAVYIYISHSNNFSLLLLSDDMAYAIRSGAVIGAIGLLIAKRMER